MCNILNVNLGPDFLKNLTLLIGKYIYIWLQTTLKGTFRLEQRQRCDSYLIGFRTIYS